MMRLPQPALQDIEFTGGLDLVTPPFKAKPGTCRQAQNFEIGINGGYDRISGYERYDGRPSPSDAQYAIIDCTFSAAVAVGSTVTGLTSGATAEVIAVTADYLAVTRVAGAFTEGESLQVAAVTVATATSGEIIDGADTPLLHAIYRNLAADVYRADIAAVPGSGRVLGVWMLNDVKYAFRNNVAGTAAVLYRSSGSGWQAVSLGRELAFTSGGTTAIAEGDTITGATSAASAVVTRVVLESGSWASGDAAGRLIFASQTGIFQAEDLNVGASLNLATIAGDSSAIALLPDGRYEMVTHNFGGQAGTSRIYGCDGVNRGFEFDGTVFVPIRTGMANDAPTHVICHKNHLFFSFAGSAQHSGIGAPYQWTIITGAGEIAVGDDITAFASETGSEGGAALGIYSRNSIHILYGSSSADWQLVRYRDEVGAYAYTVQQVGSTLMLDDRGLMSLATTQAYGNFTHSSISQLIHPWIIAQKRIATGSCIVRDKNQYRLFCSDGYSIYVSFIGNKLVGMMPALFPNPVRCIFSLENSEGAEEIFFGSDDGMVYQLEKGNSFDGEAIEAFLMLHFLHMGNPRLIKRYMDCALEIQGDGYAELNFSYELGYASHLIPQPNAVNTETNFAAVRWDTFTWDTFFWDGVTLMPSYLKMNGSAENVSLIIQSNSDYFAPVKLSGAILRYLPRRIKR